ncbi:MAG: polyprenyl diphosphate synthase [Patescibacteria group bacterium]|nr:polyprenyl diphosphate synthase [Patescibacteria group bacterium]
MLGGKKIYLPKGTIVPNHIAVVMDGNGRWARSKGLPPTKGHEAGARAIFEVIKASRDFGVHTLTLWGFSTENWKRPPKEVAKILSIVLYYLNKEKETFKKEGVRLVHLGRKERLPFELRNTIARIEKETKNHTNYILNLAIDYGGRDEIIRAVQKVIKDGVPPQEVTEEKFASYLDTADQPYPYPDLFIRTSGEQRTSGFLPWQMTYTEFYFEEDHLPDMTVEKLKAAILDFSRRRRRFGAKDKVVHFTFKPEVTAKLELAWWRLANIPEGKGFTQYAIEHIKEQFGLSGSLAKQAAVLMTEAVLEGKKSKWQKAKTKLVAFYKLLRNELKLAFEPALAASLEVKFWQEANEKESTPEIHSIENTASQLYAEVYRISILQAARLARLRVLAAIEMNLAVKGMGDYHWAKAEDYLAKFYTELKRRVA